MTIDTLDEQQVAEELTPVLAYGKHAPIRYRALGELEVVDVAEDGRSVFGRMFPIGEVAHVRESGISYDEEFLPGCTEAMRQRFARRDGLAAQIRFRLDHGEDFAREVGFCRSLEERPDGAYGAFELWAGGQLDKARSMLMSSHRGLSVEFRDVARPQITGRRVGRVQISISHVAATPAPVYPSAGILELRAEDADDYSETPNLDRVRAMLVELDEGR